MPPITQPPSIVLIGSRDYWFKVVEFLQQNWALVDCNDQGITCWFIGDTSGVFDEIIFPSMEEAARALMRNGFRRFADDAKAQAMMRPPEAPFTRRAHPNGRIYSSGKFWRS
jgi:hypothetical protein